MPVRDNLQLLKLRRKDGGGRTVTNLLQPSSLLWKPSVLWKRAARHRLGSC